MKRTPWLFSNAPRSVAYYGDWEVLAGCFTFANKLLDSASEKYINTILGQYRALLFTKLLGSGHSLVHGVPWFRELMYSGNSLVQ